MSMNEGSKVTYIGPSNEFVLAGEEGRLLAFASRTAAHVQMSDGVFLMDLADLDTGTRTAAVHDPLEDCLEVGGLSSFAVRSTYDEQGEHGVLNAMAAIGHLAGFSEIAEEALTLVSSRIRQDPSFREVLGHLDPEEGESLLRLAAACLVRDAFQDAEE